MIVNVGTKNSVKVLAVKETLQDYPLFKNVLVNSLNVSSDISEQPLSLEETTRGAMNRAKNAFNNCNYSFGIESGLMESPFTKSGYFNICICAIYDGAEFSLGMSSGFEYPKKVVDIAIKENVDIDTAFVKAGFNNNSDLGSTNTAIIGILTNNRVSRIDYSKQALIMALTQLENKKYFQ